MINNKVNLCFSKKAAGILLAATSFLVMACSENVKELSTLSTNELGITIPDGQSREYSYTDKNGGFYYGMTSTDDWGDWYAGMYCIVAIEDKKMGPLPITVCMWMEKNCFGKMPAHRYILTN